MCYIAKPIKLLKQKKNSLRRQINHAALRALAEKTASAGALVSPNGTPRAHSSQTCKGQLHMNRVKNHDVVIVGGGPAGLGMAIALQTVLIGKESGEHPFTPWSDRLGSPEETC